MTAIQANTLPAAKAAYTKDDIIPPSVWSKDHFGTLAYVEGVATECAGFQVGLDARMRSSRRNYRVMHSECPAPRRAGSAAVAHATAVASGSGTRLRDGSEIDGHDDWSCVQDMAAAGLFNCSHQDIEPGVVLQLTEKGRIWANALRAHKQAGGTFSNFTEEGLPEMPDCTVAPKEFYHWMDMRIDVTTIRAHVATGKLRPKLLTWSPEQVAMFGTSMAIDKAKRDVDQTGPWFMQVSSKHALELPVDVLDEPALLCFVGKKKGYIKLEGGTTDYVLADGNHRLIRAYMDDLGSRQVYMLSQAQSRAYRS